MVLKNWRKWGRATKYHVVYIHRTKGTTVDIWFPQVSKTYLRTPAEVEILDINSKRIVLKSFRTKADALKYAKNYMKKN